MIISHTVVGAVVGLGLSHTDMVQQIYVCLIRVVHCDEFLWGCV